MTKTIRPTCSWTGVDPTGTRAVGCDRPAAAVVLDRKGHRVYACEEHLASAKARAERGDLQTGLRHLPHAGTDSRPPDVHVTLT